MPIEIKELHIRITVNAPENGGGQASQPSAPPQAGGGGTADKEAIVAECVEQVLKIIQDKRER
ncbi:MAG: DUF5908 family protein [Bacteroidota bacterium]